MSNLKLGDLLSTAGVHLTDFKIHCASGKPPRPIPLDEFFDGNFKQYQEIQSNRNFKCKQILSLIHLEKDQWLFAGVYDVLGYRTQKGKTKTYYKYETSEVEGLDHLTGRVIVQFNKEFRASYLKGPKYVDQLVVIEIRPSKMSRHVTKSAMLNDLYEKVKTCHKCSQEHFGIRKTKAGEKRKVGLKKVGYGSNPDKAKIVIIGQNPGWSNQDEKDIHEANPFEMRRFSKNDWTQCKHGSGKNLGRAFQKTGIDFDLIYITNSVQCTTEQDNYPSSEQATNCREWFLEELEIINPKVVICLGKPACECMGATKEAKIKRDNYTLFGADHPSYRFLDYDNFQKTIEEAVSLVL